MIERKYIELIHYEIDGATSPEESAKLQEYLSKNSEARKLHDDLADLSNMLSHVEQVEPSPNLKKHILNTIPREKYARTRSREEDATWLRSLRNRLSPGHVYSFSFGLLFGLLLFFLLGDDAMMPLVENSELTGTVLLNGPVDDLAAFETIQIDLPELKGSVALKESGDLLLAQINLITENGLEFRLQFDPYNLQFRGFQQRESFPSKVTVAGGDLSLMHKGENAYLFLFSNLTPEASQVIVSVFDEIIIYENTISTQSRVQ